MIQTRFRVTPLETVVLLHHVWHCEDAANDADRTVQEIIAEIDGADGNLPKGLLESALYCCNMESERNTFRHPLGLNFDRFVRNLLENKHLEFDKYYNVIKEVKHGAQAKPKEHPEVGSDS